MAFEDFIVIGQYAMTPDQLQTAGIIKPGSASLVQSLVNRGTPLANAMPPSLFTGKFGVDSLASLQNNLPAQAGAMLNNLQSAQASLTNAGLLTGNESGTAVAGIISAGATVGVPQTIAAIKAAATPPKLASAAVGGLTNAKTAAQGAASKALGAIGAGNMAGKVADSVTSGLGSLKDSMAGLAASKGLSSALEQTQGLAATAFNAIKDSFPTMPAGIPVDVEQVAKQAAAKAEAASAAVTGAATNIQSAIQNPASALTNTAQSATASLQNSLSGGAAALGKPLPGVSAVTSAIQTTKQQVTAALPAVPSAPRIAFEDVFSRAIETSRPNLGDTQV